VAQYLADFEDLANRIIGLPAPFLLSYFISGLNADIHCEVQAHQPLTLVQVAGLARLQEEKFVDARQNPHPPPLRPRHQPSPLPHPITPHVSSPPIRPVSTPSLLPPPPRQPGPSVKRFSLEEIASRRERGLCFNCEEKYHRGHRCASRVFLIVAEEDEPYPSIIEPTNPMSPDLIDPYPA